MKRVGRRRILHKAKKTLCYNAFLSISRLNPKLMENTYYQFTVPVFVRSLSNLMAILGKAKVFARETGISESPLIQSRLAPDMFSLGKQVQVAADNAKGGAARLAGVEVPTMEDTETTFDELIARLGKTIAFLNTLQPEQFADAAQRKITLPWMPEGMYYEASTYLRDFLIANFYFHYTTAYDILRNQGVSLGKEDFAANIPMLKD